MLNKAFEIGNAAEYCKTAFCISISAFKLSTNTNNLISYIFIINFMVYTAIEFLIYCFFGELLQAKVIIQNISIISSTIHGQKIKNGPNCTKMRFVSRDCDLGNSFEW